jgi:thiol-disulfide isomerase/thioredoxin
MNEGRGEREEGRGLAGFASVVVIVLLTTSLLPGCGRPSAGSVDLGSIDAPGLAKLVEDHRGQVVLVDFWATWCVPCVALLPHTVDLHDRFAARGLAVITVSLDELEARPAVLKLLADHRATTENFLASYGVGSAEFTAFGIDSGALPHLRLYDRQGKLYRSFGGNVHAEEIRRAVEEVLGRDEGLGTRRGKGNLFALSSP